MNADDIFVAALEIADLTERNCYLEQACAGDPGLRLELESLLQAHGCIGEFLQKPPTVPLAADPRLKSSEKRGDWIGRYKLLEIIGEGGFGVVWLAEQEEPVRRRVALKVIKLGMDTRQ